MKDEGKTTVADIVATGLAAAVHMADGAPAAPRPARAKLPPPPTRPGYVADLLDD